MSRGKRVSTGVGAQIQKRGLETSVGQLREQRTDVHDRAHDSELGSVISLAELGGLIFRVIHTKIVLLFSVMILIIFSIYFHERFKLSRRKRNNSSFFII